LTGANLTSANLTGANLTSANLTGANLTGANCKSAICVGATMVSLLTEGSVWRNADLSSTKREKWSGTKGDCSGTKW
jgi:uncharacterized protein YjbI with pentapeptide repeats